MPSTEQQRATQTIDTMPLEESSAQRDLQFQQNLGGMSYSQQASALAPDRPVQMRKLPTGEEEFDKMWAAHPHAAQEEYASEGGSADQNTDSDTVLSEQGLPAWLGNTCAIRLSTMLNGLGGAYRITPAKTKAAGVKRRPMYSRKTKSYYILAASEMWKYLTKYYRKADQYYPTTGKFKNGAEFTKAFEEGDGAIKKILAGKKGIVAFETIFTYSGTGHVDIFDGTRLSDAAMWYPCKRLHLWYVVP